MAANFTQQNRFITIDTPLGADKLLLRSFSGTEALSKVFNFQLELLSEDHNIDISKILGERVTVAINLPENQGGQRYFNGFICRFKQLPSISRFARYQAEMIPWLWFLTRTTDCKIFQKEAVPDIIEKVFRQFNFQDFERELQKSYEPWEYCVQYRETACNFVMRLLEMEGIYFFFRHEKGRHVLVMADTPNAHKSLDPKKITYEYIEGAGYAQEESRIDSWLIDHDLRTGRYAVTDYNFETPSRSLLANVDSSINVGNNHVYEIYDYPGGYDSRDEGDKYVRLRMEEEEVEHATIQAEGNCQHFTSGYRFELTGHNRRDQNKEYVLTSVIHDASIGGNFPDSTGAEDHHYRNRFTCIPYSVPFRPSRHTPKTVVQGTQTAVVVGPKGEEIYTDKYGRVKVQFHWDRYGKFDENSSCWVRVSHPWAGKGWGSVSIPRIGQEVIVDFLEGDPDLPIITGRVYNAETMPPYDLPASGVVSGIKSNTHKGKGYNEMSMDDTAGKEKITVHGQYDMNTTVEHDQTTTVHNNRTDKIDVNDSETVGSNQSVSIGANRTESVGGTETITITGHRTETVNGGETVTVNAGRSHTVNGVQTTTISLAEVHSVGAGRMHNVGAAEAITVGAAQMVNVGGAQMVSVGGIQKVNVGALQSISVAGPHKLSAAIISETSKGPFKIKAGAVCMVEAPTIILKAGGSKIIMDSGGITIKGAKITIKANGSGSFTAGGSIKIKGSSLGED